MRKSISLMTYNELKQAIKDSYRILREDHPDFHKSKQIKKEIKTMESIVREYERNKGMLNV